MKMKNKKLLGYLLLIIVLTFSSIAVYSASITLPKTGQITSYYAGDDGDLEKGANWPNPRFTNTDGTSPITGMVVVDQLTGLMWTKCANTPGTNNTAVCTGGSGTCGTSGQKKTFTAALDWVGCLNSNNYLGYNDWRLPNVIELESLVNQESNNLPSWLNTYFTSVQAGGTNFYWAATTYAASTNKAWVVSFASTEADGGNANEQKHNGPFNKDASYSNWILPVRGPVN